MFFLFVKICLFELVLSVFCSKCRIVIHYVNCLVQVFFLFLLKLLLFAVVAILSGFDGDDGISWYMLHSQITLPRTHIGLKLMFIVYVIIF